MENRTSESPSPSVRKKVHVDANKYRGKKGELPEKSGRGLVTTKGMQEKLSIMT